MSWNEPRYSHVGSGQGAEVVEGIMGTAGDHGLHGDLRYWPVPELVALDLPGGMGFVDALRAIWDTGDAAAPLDPRLPARRAPGAARRLAPDPDRGLRRGTARAAPTASPVEEGDALVVATSGTSGQPKGVVLTHDAVAASAPGHLGAARRRPRPALVAGLPAPGPHRRPVRRHPCHRHRHAARRPARVRGRDRRGGGTVRARDPRLAGGDRTAAARPVGLQLRAPRRQQGARRAAAQRRRPPTA